MIYKIFFFYLNYNYWNCFFLKKKESKKQSFHDFIFLPFVFRFLLLNDYLSARWKKKEKKKKKKKKKQFDFASLFTFSFPSQSEKSFFFFSLSNSPLFFFLEKNQTKKKKKVYS